MTLGPRFLTACLVCCSLLLTTADANATNTDPLTLTPLTQNTFVLHGLSGLPNPDNGGMIANTGFVLTNQGVVVIDSGGGPEHAELLLKAIRMKTPLPVIAVFNTHVHGDHWLGNHRISEAYPHAKFYAHPALIDAVKNGAGDQWAALYQQLTQSESMTTLRAPTNATRGEQEFDFGNITIRVIHTNTAHTNNDIMILISEADNKSSVIFLGDNAFNQRLGRMDDGHFKGNIAALDTAIELAANFYVPGHGPATPNTDAATQYRDYLETIYSLSTPLVEAGLADFEIKQQILPKFDRWRSWEGFEDGFGRQVSLVFLEIEADQFQ